MSTACPAVAREVSTACQTGAAPAAPAPISVTAPRPLDRMLVENYGGRPVDRVAEEIERAMDLEHHLGGIGVTYRALDLDAGG